MPKELIESTTLIAAQSDRWMFVCLLLIGVFSIGILFRYFTGRLDSLQDRMDKQNSEFISHLKTANTEMLEVIAAAKSVIERVEKKLNT